MVLFCWNLGRISCLHFSDIRYPVYGSGFACVVIRNALLPIRSNDEFHRDANMGLYLPIGDTRSPQFAHPLDSYGGYTYLFLSLILIVLNVNEEGN